MSSEQLSVDGRKVGGRPSEAGAPDGADAPRGSQGRRGVRLPSLTGLRFPAALLVFLYHAALPIPSLRLLESDDAQNAFTRAAEQAGALGVSFFFVLSGFVLTWSVRERDGAGAFLRRRFVKIYPNYVVTWLLAMLLFAHAFTDFWRAAANLLMLQVWIPDFDTYFSVNTPSWSLGVELVFYASFPLLYALLRRIPAHRLKYWAAGAVVGVFALPFAAYRFLPSTPQVPGGYDASPLQYWVTYVLPPTRLLEFGLGILVALMVRNGRWRNIGLLWSGALLAGAYVLTGFVPYLYAQRSICVVPIVLVIAAAATADIEGRPSLLRTRRAVWLGEISFAFYLLHYVVLTYGREVLGDDLFSTPATIGLLLAEAVVAVWLSWALYGLVERPLTRRWSQKRTPLQPDTTSTRQETHREH